MEVLRIVASVKTRPVYSCGSCGVKAQGDTINLSFDVDSAQEIADHIRQMGVKSAHMPVGWSFHGEFECSICRKGEDD